MVDGDHFLAILRPQGDMVVETDHLKDMISIDHALIRVRYHLAVLVLMPRDLRRGRRREDDIVRDVAVVEVQVTAVTVGVRVRGGAGVEVAVAAVGDMVGTE